MKVLIDDTECDINFHKYPNKRTAIELVDSKDGSPYGRVTINLSDLDISNDEVAIDPLMKDFIPTLQECGLLGKELRTAVVDFTMYTANYTICELLFKG